MYVYSVFVYMQLFHDVKERMWDRKVRLMAYTRMYGLIHMYVCTYVCTYIQYIRTYIVLHSYSSCLN